MQWIYVLVINVLSFKTYAHYAGLISTRILNLVYCVGCQHIPGIILPQLLLRPGPGHRHQQAGVRGQWERGPRLLGRPLPHVVPRGQQRPHREQPGPE